MNISSFASTTQTVLRKFVFERRRSRQFLSSLAEWCAAYRGKKGVCQKSVLAKIAIWLSESYKLKSAVFGTFDTPSLVSYRGAHHSAANAVSERNLLRKVTKIRQLLQPKRACPCESQFPFGRSKRRFNVMLWVSEMRVVSVSWSGRFGGRGIRECTPLGVQGLVGKDGLAGFRRPSGLRGSVGMDGREGRRTPSGVRGRFHV